MRLFHERAILEPRLEHDYPPGHPLQQLVLNPEYFYALGATLAMSMWKKHDVLMKPARAGSMSQARWNIEGQALLDKHFWVGWFDGGGGILNMLPRGGPRIIIRGDAAVIQFFVSALQQWNQQTSSDSSLRDLSEEDVAELLYIAERPRISNVKSRVYRAAFQGRLGAAVCRLFFTEPEPCSPDLWEAVQLALSWTPRQKRRSKRAHLRNDFTGFTSDAVVQSPAQGARVSEEDFHDASVLE